MTDPNRETPDLLDTPIMPTGSGVADLEIARELDAVSAGAVPTDPGMADAGDSMPTVDNAAARESESHPS